VTTTIPEVLADLPRVRARAIPSAVALSCGGRDTTYGALDERSSRVATGLIAVGCRPAARIAYLGKNSDSYFEILLGAAKARVALVAVNWRLAPPEIEYVLGDSGARILVVDPQQVEDPKLRVEPTDTVLQMYSSGTTGRPKGVEIPQMAFAPLRQAERELGAWRRSARAPPILS
jgi:acyl-CoA synthetase (AMP-forming)/AMP-acid ligase II